jgi:hypothetical protein
VKYPDFDGNEPCASVGVDHFYQESSSVPASNAAKAVCNGCHSFDKCLEWAILHETYGVWAGTTGFERREIRKRMNLFVSDPIVFTSPSDRAMGVSLHAS